MTEILVLQAQIRVLAGYASNTNPEVWTAKIGHFHGFGQAVTYLETQGETLVQARRNLLQMTVDMVAQSESQETGA
ncbi:hypothetical protein KCU78_g5124, partial [Aureobasidium melanogenum]